MIKKNIQVNLVAAGIPNATQEILINYGNYYKPVISETGVVSWEFIPGTVDGVEAVPSVQLKSPGIRVLGLVNNLASLPSNSEVGECYAVGTVAPFTYYIFDGTDWISHGQLVTGYFTPNVDNSGMISWSNNIGLSNPVTQSIVGPQGIQGIQGATGATGSSTQWFSGTTVSGTGTGISGTVTGSKAYDMYLNTTTGSVYQATDANTWDYKLTIVGEDGEVIELQATSSFIQWRYPEEAWQNLISIASISGATPTLSVDESGNLYVDYITNTSDLLQRKASALTIEIAVADWSSGTSCTKTATGVTTDSIVFCDPSDGDVECSAQDTDELTFICTTTPTEVITVKVVVLP